VFDYLYSTERVLNLFEDLFAQYDHNKSMSAWRESLYRARLRIREARDRKIWDDFKGPISALTNINADAISKINEIMDSRLKEWGHLFGRRWLIRWFRAEEREGYFGGFLPCLKQSRDEVVKFRMTGTLEEQIRILIDLWKGSFQEMLYSYMAMNGPKFEHYELFDGRLRRIEIIWIAIAFFGAILLATSYRMLLYITIT
jgi:hypothetical protein